MEDVSEVELNSVLLDDEDRLQQAAEWFALLQSGTVTEDERQNWQCWFSSDKKNAVAWGKVEHISQRFSGLPVRASRAALKSSGITRRQSLKALALVFMTGGATWQIGRQQHWSAQYRTARGEIRQFILEDGSRLWLNTATAVDVIYGEKLREIMLREGELYVETAPDNAVNSRPLVVNTSQGRLEALGTQFSVRQYETKTRLSVEDGAVQIRLNGRQKEALTQRVGVGQQVDFNASSIGTVSKLQPVSWRQGSILANNMRLSDFVDELNRYHHGYLSVDSSAADLRLVGAFPIEDLDRILAALEKTLPISVHHTLPWWVKIQAV